jgi:hypothetical protein
MNMKTQSIKRAVQLLRRFFCGLLTRPADAATLPHDTQKRSGREPSADY